MRARVHKIVDLLVLWDRDLKIDLWAEKSKQESEQDTKNSKELWCLFP